MNSSEIFQHSVCLSQEVLIRYVKGELNAAEKRNVELHLADCEICFDTVEGLSLVEKERLTNIQQELAGRIQNRIAQDDKIKVIPIYRKWYAMAAAIAALIMISVYVVNVYEKDNELARVEKNEQPITTDNNPAKIESEVLSSQGQITKPNVKEMVSAKKEETVAVSDVPAEKIIETKYQSNNGIAMDNAQPAAGKTDIVAPEMSAPTIVDAGATETIAIATKEIAKATDDEADKQPVNDKVVMETRTAVTATKKAKSSADAAVPAALSGTAVGGNSGTFDYNTYDIGVSSFNEGDYAKAVNAMNTLLKSQPNNVNVNYYAGAANYELKNYTKAIAQLNLVTLNKRSTFYEAALWYKGNALLKLDDKKEAKTTLQKVVKQNGKYKQQAEELLKTL